MGEYMTTLTTEKPTDRDVELARVASSILSAHADALGRADGRLRVQVDASEDLVELPHMVTRLLQMILENITAGRAINIVPLNAELTTQQAADMLGVSRPFLIKLLKDDQIEYRTVGRHRRIQLVELLKFKEKNKKERAKALDELTKIGQELGGYE